MKQGRKFWLALIWGATLVGVLIILLAKGVTSDAVIGAWLAAFVSIPVQFGITNVMSKHQCVEMRKVENGKNMGIPC